MNACTITNQFKCFNGVPLCEFPINASSTNESYWMVLIDMRIYGFIFYLECCEPKKKKRSVQGHQVKVNDTWHSMLHFVFKYKNAIRRRRQQWMPLSNNHYPNDWCCLRIFIVIIVAAVAAVVGSQRRYRYCCYLNSMNLGDGLCLDDVIRS